METVTKVPIMEIDGKVQLGNYDTTVIAFLVCLLCLVVGMHIGRWIYTWKLRDDIAYLERLRKESNEERNA